ncbi:MAG: carbohydrate ABC transporter permease [Candidatus Vecturithrix sp.]|jgi:glucose/mannose transport system permease protein|nr:carbohydrate ABC transporter permease [Candidatus Vecturithrix sp.]
MKERCFTRITVVLLLLLSIPWLLPVYAMLTTSVKTQAEVAGQHYLQLPETLNWSNYAVAFKALKQGLLNSIIITIPATFLCIFFGSLGGYFLTMFDFKPSQLIFFGIVVASFLPYQIVVIPITRFLSMFNLLNSYSGLILIYVILNLPMGTLITATFFMKLPKSILEAAIIDGCKPIAFYHRILIPLSIPGLISAAILVFVQVYNEFLLGIVVTRGPQVKPVMPILAELKGSQIAQWHIQMAGAVITALIPLAVFIFLSNYFIAGLTVGYASEE